MPFQTVVVEILPIFFRQRITLYTTPVLIKTRALTNIVKHPTTSVLSGIFEILFHVCRVPQDWHGPLSLPPSPGKVVVSRSNEILPLR